MGDKQGKKQVKTRLYMSFCLFIDVSHMPRIVPGKKWDSVGICCMNEMTNGMILLGCHVSNREHWRFETTFRNSTWQFYVELFVNGGTRKQGNQLGDYEVGCGS